MSPLTITVHHAPTGPVLAVAGTLDFDHAAQLRQAVTDLALEQGQLLVLDLARLDFCDSSGITAFIVARHHATAAGARVALASVPENTARVLHLVGLDQIFTLHPDAGAATAQGAGH
ncbi:STAS domain-containing protein [Streptomyces stramineus]|uniref:Anti-sigma factor antagonist n=1 Tax=Streptomyces stramineus TaxID=173861 RepID=A0ABN0ZVF8_9ACTN